MTTKRSTHYCRQCGMNTTRSAVLEPLVVDTTLYDCRGVEHPRRVGLDAVACDVCGHLTVDDDAARVTFETVQASFITHSFSRHVADLGTAVQDRIARYCAWVATVWLPLAMLSGAVLATVWPNLAIGVQVPIYAVAFWALRYGVCRERLFTESVDAWLAAMPEAKAIKPARAADAQTPNGGA